MLDENFTFRGPSSPHEISVPKAILDDQQIDLQNLGKFFSAVSQAEGGEKRLVTIDKVADNTISYHIGDDSKTIQIDSLASNTVTPLILKESSIDEVWSSESPPSGPLKEISKILRKLVRKLAQVFVFLDPKREQFEVNLSLLQSCLGDFSKGSELRMSEVLKYQIELASDDPGLAGRLKRARALAKKVEASQRRGGSGQKRGAVELTQMIQSQIRKHDQVLIPAGFFSEDAFVDVLLEVKKTGDGMVSVRMMTLHEGFEGKFDEEKEEAGWRRLPVRDYENVPLQTFTNEVLPVLSSLQMPKAYEGGKDSGLLFTVMRLFSKEAPEKVPDTVVDEKDFMQVVDRMGKPVAISESQELKFKKTYAEVGKAKTVYTYLQTFKPEKYQELKLQGELNLVRQLWKESHEWKEDAGFRSLVRAACVKAIGTAYKHREALYGSDVTTQELELESLQADLGRIIAEIDQFECKIPLEKGVKVSSEPFGAIDLPSIVQLSSAQSDPVARAEIELNPMPTDDPKVALKVLKEWIATGNALKDSKQFVKLEEFATSAIFQLPDLDDMFWSKVSSEEIVADQGWAESMRDLGELLVIARARQDLGEDRGNIATTRMMAAAYLCLAQNKLVENKSHEGRPLGLGAGSNAFLAFDSDLFQTMARIGRDWVPPGIAKAKVVQIHKAIKGKEDQSVSLLRDPVRDDEVRLESKKYKELRKYFLELGDADIAYRPRSEARLPKTFYCLQDQQLYMQMMMTDCQVANPIKHKGVHADELRASETFRVNYNPTHRVYTVSPRLTLMTNAIVQWGGGYNSYTGGGTRYGSPLPRHLMRTLAYGRSGLSYPVAEKTWKTLFAKRYELRHVFGDKYVALSYGQPERFIESPESENHIAPRGWYRSSEIDGLSESDVKDLKMLQVASRSPVDALIGVFFKSSNQMRFFERGDLQSLFESKLFMGDKLEKWVEKKPDSCADFLKRIAFLYDESASTHPVTATYMLKLTAIVNTVVSASTLTDEKKQAITSASIPGYEEKLKSVMVKTEGPEQRFACQTFLDLKSREQAVPKDEIPDYLFAKYKFNTLAAGKWNSPIINDNISRFEMVSGSQIVEEVASDPKLQKKIVQKIAPKDLHDKNWDYHEGMLTYAEHTIDIRKGLYLVDGGSTTTLPKEIASQCHGVFDGELPLCQLSFQVGADPKEQMMVYRPHSMPHIQVVVKVSDENNSFDVIVLEKKQINGADRLCQRVDFSQEDDIPVPVRSAIGEGHCFRDVEDPTRAFVFDQEGVLQATMKIAQKDEGEEVTNFVRTDGRELLNISHPGQLKGFDAIEHPDQILVFGKKGKAEEVVYPRLQLGSGLPLMINLPTREVRGFENARWNPNGQRLGQGIPEELREQLPTILSHHFIHFHLLEETDGSQRVLLTPRRIEGKGGVEGREIEVVSKFGKIPHLQSHEDRLEVQPLYDYSLTEKGRLRAETPEANLYLAYVFLSRRDYVEALHYLKEAKTSYALTEQAGKILGWMREWPDTSENGNAFKLHLYCYTHQNLMERGELSAIGELEQRELRGFAEAYRRYEKGNTNVSPALQLQPSQHQQCKAIADESIERVMDELCQRATTKVSERKPVQLPIEIPDEDRAGSLTAQLYLKMGSCKSSKLTSSSGYFILNSHARLIKDFKVLYEILRTEDVTSPRFKRLAAEIDAARPNSAEGSLAPVAKSYLQILVRARQQGKSPNEITPFPSTLERSWTAAGKMKDFADLQQAMEKEEGEEKLKDHPIMKLEALLKELSKIGQTLDLPEAEDSLPRQAAEVTINQEALASLPVQEQQFWNTLLGGAGSDLLEEGIEVVGKLKETGKLEEAIRVREGSKLGARVRELKERSPVDLPKVTSPAHVQDDDEIKKNEKLQKKFSVEQIRSSGSEQRQAQFFERYESSSGPVQNLATRLVKSMEEHFRDRPKTRLSLNEAGLVDVTRETEANVSSLRERLATEQIALIHQVKGAQAGSDRARRAMGEKVDPSIEGLIAKYIDGTLEENLAVGLERVLDTANQLAHEQFILSGCRGLKEAPNDPVLTRALSDRLERKQQHLIGESYYDGIRGRYFRVIEYENGFLLRNAQVETITEMLDNKNAIRQLIMGGGKSKVLLPILAKAKATGKNLVAVVLPDYLFETNLKDLDDSSRKFLNQDVYAFRFDRDTSTDLRSLQNRQIQLLQVVKEKKFIATTKDSMLSFKHCFIEKLEKLHHCEDSEERAELLAEIKVIAEISQLFGEHADFLADEVQDILDVTKELNYAFGEAVELMHEHGDKVLVGVGFMRTLLEAKGHSGSTTEQLEALEALSKAVTSNTQAALDPKVREAGVRAVAETLLAEWGILDSEVVSYVMVEAKVVPESVRDLLKEERGPQVQFLKQFIRKGYGETFQRSGNLDYARHGEKVVPSAGANNPLVNATFDDDVERVSLYVTDYVQQGITQDQLRALLDFELHRARKERQVSVSEGKNISIYETDVARHFKGLLDQVDPSRTLSQQIHLGRVSSGQLERLHAAIQSNPIVSLRICEEWILPAIKLDPEQIRGNAQDLVGMVNNFSGMSGTPPPPGTVADKIETKFAEGVDGKTFSILMEMDPKVQVLHSFDPKNPTQSLIEEANLHEAQAWIDLGAYNKGHSNESVVDQVLAKNGSLSAAHFVNRSGFVVSKEQGSREAKPLPKDYKKRAETSFTFYDRYVGLDVGQAPTAKAIVTIDANTHLKNLFQAVWRLRQLDQKQTVKFAMTEEVRQLMMQGQTGDPTVADVIDFCLRNQGDQEGHHNFRAETQKITGSAPRALYKELVDQAVKAESPEAIDGPYGQVRNHLISKRDTTTDAELEAGMTDKPEHVLKEMKQKALEQYSQLPIGGEQIASGKQTLENRSIGDLSLFHDEVPAVPAFSSQSVSQSETQQQAQSQQQTRSEQFVETRGGRSFDDGEHDFVSPDLMVKATMVKATMAHSTRSSLASVYSEELTGDKKFHDKHPKLWNVLAVDADDRYRHDFDRVPVVPMGLWADFLGHEVVGFFNFDDATKINEIKKLTAQNEVGSLNSLKQLCHRDRNVPRRALIVQAGDGWRVLIGTPYEEYNQFEESVRKVSQQSGVKRVALVDLQSDDEPKVVEAVLPEGLSSINPFTTKQERKKFLELVTKIRFFNGEMNYPLKEHRQALEDWVQPMGRDKARQYYEEAILPSLPNERRREYHGSWLQNFLNSGRP